MRSIEYNNSAVGLFSEKSILIITNSMLIPSSVTERVAFRKMRDANISFPNTPIDVGRIMFIKTEASLFIIYIYSIMPFARAFSIESTIRNIITTTTKVSSPKRIAIPLDGPLSWPGSVSEIECAVFDISISNPSAPTVALYPISGVLWDA